MDARKTADRIVQWLQEHKEQANAKGFVVGLSGGVDSAVAAALAKLACPDGMLAIIMPCYSDPQDAKDAMLTAEALQIPVKTVDLGPVYDALFAQANLDPEAVPLLARANVKPRLRMVTAYLHAALSNYLVVGAENKDELHVGYFTKYGDAGVDLLPLANLVKSEVWELARYLQVPEEVVNKVPTAGLWPDQTDEKEMGIGYDELDRYLKGEPVSDKARERIEYLHHISEHKRRPIPLGPEPVR
ncbi:MAG: NAD(+) synthase [Firmicutes bacterium]|nr:NAD(+) synthase [Bacillota bacterium]